MVTTILLVALVGLAILAQAYRIQRDVFAAEVLKQYEWIDEIIEDLKEINESEA